MSPTSTSATPPVQLTRDETRILEECNRESLIYRSIPVSLCTFFATQYAMSKNMISTKGKWFKISAAIIAGYMLGKISYTSACRRKILAETPDSSLGQLIRGVDATQIAPVDFHTHEQNQNQDDTQSVSMDVNKYGDAIYKTNK